MPDAGRPFGDDPLVEEHRTHAAIDRLLVDEDHLVDEITADLEGHAVVEADAAAEQIGKRGEFLRRRPDGRPRDCRHRRSAVHADPDDADGGLQRLRRQRDPRNEAAARERHDQRLDVWLPVEDLERDRALPGDHVEMVEGRDLVSPSSSTSRSDSFCASSCERPTRRTSAPSSRSP